MRETECFVIKKRCVPIIRKKKKGPLAQLERHSLSREQVDAAVTTKVAVPSEKRVNIKGNAAFVEDDLRVLLVGVGLPAEGRVSPSPKESMKRTVPHKKIVHFDPVLPDPRGAEHLYLSGDPRGTRAKIQGATLEGERTSEKRRSSQTFYVRRKGWKKES